jgi:HlyD family secretion protein
MKTSKTSAGGGLLSTASWSSRAPWAPWSSMATRPRAVAGTVALLVGGWLVSQGVTAKVDQTAPDEATSPTRPVLAVTAEAVQTSPVDRLLSVNGSVAAWQEASVGAEVEGLRLVDVRVNVGDAVRRGQVLAVFETSLPAAELEQAQAAMAEAQAQAHEAQANAQRARDLKDSGAMSHQQIQQYLAQEEVAQARLRAQKAAVQLRQVRLQRTQVQAPDDGVISARNATLGAVTSPGQELFKLIRQGRLEWRAEVPSEQLGDVRAGGPVTLWTNRGERIEGRVRQVAPTVDTRTRTGLVYVDVPRTPATLVDFKSGMFARGEFKLARHTGLTVPDKAVLVRDGFSYVFQVDGQQQVRRVKVQTGQRAGGRIEVASGLDAKARVVAGGVGFLNDGDTVRVVGTSLASTSTATSTSSASTRSE